MWKNNQQEAFGRNNSPSTDAVAVTLVQTQLVVLNKETTHPLQQRNVKPFSVEHEKTRCFDPDCLGQC